MADNPIGMRQSVGFNAISTTLSFNKTASGSIIGCTLIADLSSSVGVSKNTKFNGHYVCILNQSTQPTCKGDAAGSAGGIKSGTVGGQCIPIEGSNIVYVNELKVVRHGDKCTMNNGNCLGTYVALTSPAPTEKSHKSYNPPIPLTPKQQSIYDSIKKWLNEKISEVNEAILHPLEGAKGAIKDTLNIPPTLLDASIKAEIQNAAEEADTQAAILALFGDKKVSAKLEEAARSQYEVADKVDLPKLTLNNPAQKGGATLAMLFPFIPGTLKKVVTTEAKVTEAAGGGVKVLGKSTKSRAIKYREDLGGKPGGIGKNRNIATSDYYIDGVFGEADAISGKGSMKGFVDIPDPSKRFFETKSVSFPRAFDSEAKILEYIGSKITTNSKGTINLFSELPICNSCQGVIEQFGKQFPNVQVNIIK